MRKLPVAVAALLACAASQALAQSGSGTPQAEPPPAVEVAPNPLSPPPPPKPEAIPAAPKAPRVTDKTPGRFSFNRVDDGFLRLDRQSGEVAYCSPHTVGWACQPVPEDGAALEKEIARLRDEVASLKAQVAALHEPPPPRPPADLTPQVNLPPPAAQMPPPVADKDQDAAKLRADLGRARLAFENAWRRLVEMIVQLQKDMMRRG